jgi:hypothetical protein
MGQNQMRGAQKPHRNHYSCDMAAKMAPHYSLVATQMDKFQNNFVPAERLVSLWCALKTKISG